MIIRSVKNNVKVIFDDNVNRKDSKNNKNNKNNGKISSNACSKGNNKEAYFEMQMISEEI